MIRNIVLAAALLSAAANWSAAGPQKSGPTKEKTAQPDKVLYDSAVKDIEHKRFDLARLQLQTLTNTYGTSGYLTAAKFAIAESWYKQGGEQGLAQAEAECNDFLRMYSASPQAAAAQNMLQKIKEARNKGKTRSAK